MDDDIPIPGPSRGNVKVGSVPSTPRALFVPVLHPSAIDAKHSSSPLLVASHYWDAVGQRHVITAPRAAAASLSCLDAGCATTALAAHTCMSKPGCCTCTFQDIMVRAAQLRVAALYLLAPAPLRALGRYTVPAGESIASRWDKCLTVALADYAAQARRLRALCIGKQTTPRY